MRALTIIAGCCVALACACGPSTSADGHGSTGGSADDGDTEPAVTSIGTSTLGTTGTDSSVDTTSAPGDDGYEEDTGGTGCAFLCPSPGSGGGGGGTIFECDLWAQDCPDGEKCMPWANDGGAVWNATRCAPLHPDPNQPGEPCTVEGSGVSGIDDCDAAQMCWDVDRKTNTGVCIALCQGTPVDPVCAGEDVCLAYSAVISYCVAPCDRLTQDCGPMQACANELGPPLCMPAGNAHAGDDCSTEPCSAGTVCLDGDAVPGCTALACCTPYCDPTAPQCPEGGSCQAATDTPDVGTCVTP